MRHRIAALPCAIALALLAAPPASDAQQPAKIPRIGYLGGTTPSAFPHFLERFRQGLRELGFVEGQNVTIEYRWAEGKADRLPALAAELARLKVDVILAAGGSPGALAAKQATTTIPVVFVGVADAVGLGLVASLARPGGNLTGLAFLTPEVNEKRLELLKEVAPGVSRVAVLLNPGSASHEEQLKGLVAAARALGLQLQPVGVQRADEFEGAFAAMSRGHAGALMILPSPVHHRNLKQIADLAAKHRLPSMCEFDEFVGVGGLLAYGPSWADTFRRAGAYVGKILKGAKPADLPVEQPTRFELLVNLRTAKALGLTVPQMVLFRADKVIE